MGAILIISISFLLLYFVRIVLAQANTNGPPSIVGTILQTDCRTYPFSTQFEIICPLRYQDENLGICDSHCRCIHKAKWGRCEKRPPNAPAGTGLGDSWCICSYEEPPQGKTRNPNDLVLCPLWQLADKVCHLAQINDTAGVCSTDCICAHGFKNGYCDKENYCICTNLEVNPANTYGTYPFMSLINQALMG